MSKYQDPIHEEYPSYDYSQVEDTAGVDYKIAIYLSVGYIFLHLFGRFLPQPIWVFITTGLVIVIWYYFRRYFDAVNDISTSRWVNVAIVGYILFGVINLWVLTSLSMDQIIERVRYQLDPVGYLEYLSNTIFTGVGIAILMIVGACVRLLMAQKLHPFSLRGIAVTTMMVTPFYMFFCIYQNAEFIKEFLVFLNITIELIAFFSGSNFDTIGNEIFQVGVVGNLFFMIPYFFLLRHFYRADSEDVTP